MKCNELVDYLRDKDMTLYCQYTECGAQCIEDAIECTMASAPSPATSARSPRRSDEPSSRTPQRVPGREMETIACRVISCIDDSRAERMR
jgi:hypothetical protein